jgi:uncharacterized protein YdeI (YjbR/CyaY-like superfamily)
MSSRAGELPELVVSDASAWREWLSRHHGDPRGVRLVLAKKGAMTPTSLTHAEALVEALAHGWIDGQADRRDDATWTVRFTPRQKRSRWSKRNTVTVERLLGEGKMHPAGIAEVERAKADGRWEAAYEGSANIEVPDDLAAALDSDPAAKAMFATLTAANRYAILYRIEGAKRTETRMRRIETLVAMLARGETLYPQGRSAST